MTPTELRTAILADPEAAAYAAAGRDSDCAVRLSAILPQWQRPVSNVDITRHGVLSGYWSAVVIAADSEQTPTQTRGLAIAAHAWISDTQATTDFSLPAVQAMLSGLVTAGLMTEAQQDELLTMSYQPRQVSADEVSAAMAIDRPEGKVVI